MPHRPSPIRRRATGALAGLLLGFGALGAAADPLVIEADGVVRIGPPAGEPLTVERDRIRVGKPLSFGNRIASLMTLWEPGYTIGIQSSTMYFRTDKNFAWFKGGAHDGGEIQPGAGGATLMALSATPAAGKGTLDVNGTITGMGAVPVGAILMWSGDPAALPKGWALCDGQNGTPDLRGMFIAGLKPGDADYGAVGASGKGQATITLPNHTHGLGDPIPVIGTHSHDWALSSTTGAGANGTAWSGHLNKPWSTGVLEVGYGAAIDNRPPYYVLAYIIYRGE
jgi:microcystin-dependent protein